MLQVQVASCTSTAACTLAFLPLLVTWNWESWSSYAFLFEIWVGSKYGLHLCARSLITTCRWPLRCNWGDHSLVKLNSLFKVQRTMCMSCFQDSQLFVVASHCKEWWSDLHSIYYYYYYYLGVAITLIHVCCWASKFVRVLWFVCGCLF